MNEKNIHMELSTGTTHQLFWNHRIKKPPACLSRNLFFAAQKRPNRTEPFRNLDFRPKVRIDKGSQVTKFGICKVPIIPQGHQDRGSSYDTYDKVSCIIIREIGKSLKTTSGFQFWGPGLLFNWDVLETMNWTYMKQLRRRTYMTLCPSQFPPDRWSLYDTNPNFMHYKGNPSELPYICIIWSLENG